MPQGAAIELPENLPMTPYVRRFFADESGASAVEYAVVAGIIALGLVITIGSLRDTLNHIFTNTADEIK
jgi:pilus assembly protein Flp/PilA